MSDVLTDPEVTDPDTEDGDPTYTHIVGPLYTEAGKIPGRTRIMEAMINGTAVEAICGYLWVPFRNPENYPLCPRCEEIVSRSGDNH